MTLIMMFRDKIINNSNTLTNIYMIVATTYLCFSPNFYYRNCNSLTIPPIMFWSITKVLANIPAVISTL